MRGNLVASFCERSDGQPSRCLEIWSYPDSSLNLVVNRLDEKESQEHVFPCAPHHLVEVLKYKTFHSVTEHGTIFMNRNETVVKAEFTSGSKKEYWSHDVSVGAFAEALAVVSDEVPGFGFY
jgi:hypothetical protein